MTRVKICGITNLRDLELVTGLGVNAVGVITGIPSSGRNVSLELAETIMDHTPVFTKSVLVIAPQSFEEAIEACDLVKPDAVQIHGGDIELGEFSRALPGTRIILSVNANEQDASRTALNVVKLCDAVLLDSSTSSRLGGTGRVHDWMLSRQICEAVKPKPLILAGGLCPGNVKEAVLRVRPYAVDVCTGTEERPGVKDPEKVKLFLSSVKEADGMCGFE